MPEQGGSMVKDTFNSPDVAVIGGGVIGLAIAWRAAVRGLRPIVLERGRVGAGTSFHAAGMIAPASEATPGEEPLLALGQDSAARYPEFVAGLEADAGGESVGYRRCGTLLVARDGDEAEALERELALRTRSSLDARRLRPSEARRLEPALAPALRLALELPDDHAVDPRALCAALARAVVHRGGQVREGTAVAGLDAAGVVLEDGSRLTAEHVVIAGGVWSDALDGVGDGVGLRPVKGQIMRLHDPAGPGLLERVIRFGAAYVVPRGDGRYVIGATSEERGFDTTVTAGAAYELLREAGELVPGISELVLDEFTAGLRPATPDSLPAIGPSATANVWWATGHFRGGVLLAPATAELMVGMLCGDPADRLAAALAPARFATTTAARPERVGAR
jgi:glycine oxidase